jgi:predicted lipoprotein
MDHVQRPDRRALLSSLAWLAAVALALYIFPPFHIRPLERGAGVQPATVPGAIDVPKFAEKFWNEQLVNPAVQAADATAVFAALNENTATAMEKYGRRAGIGGKALFLVSGAGRVSAVDRRGVWLQVDGASDARIVLNTGPIFGNALRDVTGLLKIEDFSSFDFNALSAELNRLAETHAQPGLRADGKVGATLSFIAAGELDDASGAQAVLKLIPIRVTLKQ